MKLISLQIKPAVGSGLGSEELEFGDHVTQLSGPNGCGKTPMLQTIAFCLGYPSVFRNDIYDQCDSASLKVETDGEELVLTRVFERNTVDIHVLEPNGQTQSFFNELDYSSYIFERIGLKQDQLVSNANKITSPYLATLLPIYYLDQDDGYARYYCPPNSFIKDQFSEMVRMVFDLPVKNSFALKKARIDAKEKLKSWDEKVEYCRRKVEAARDSLPASYLSTDQIDNEIAKLEAELKLLKSEGSGRDDALAVFDRLISTHRDSIAQIGSKIAGIAKRSHAFNQIVAEINAEIETLNLNEEARRVFLSFDEVCSNAGCQLFNSSSDSYSKNLLYLKDQIKDLERNTERDRAKEAQLLSEKQNLERLIKSVVDERTKSVEQGDISSLVAAISEIKSQVFELQHQKGEVERFELEEEKHMVALREQYKALEKYNSLGSTSNSIPAIIKLRADLKDTFIKWLECLKTPNISYEVTFKDDFQPILGEETISQLKGSTRFRAVLAYHAAVIELASMKSTGFNFLILDTPKQHEIHDDDLNRYLAALKNLCSQNGIQVVFSTTEYHYESDNFDVEWLPLYMGEEQKMFLKQY